MKVLDKEAADRISEVLLADGWHNLIIGSFKSEQGMFEFQERAFVYSTIAGPLSSVLAVRLTSEESK